MVGIYVFIYQRHSMYNAMQLTERRISKRPSAALQSRINLTLVPDMTVFDTDLIFKIRHYTEWFGTKVLHSSTHSYMMVHGVVQCCPLKKFSYQNAQYLYTYNITGTIIMNRKINITHRVLFQLVTHYKYGILSDHHQYGLQQRH